MDKYQIESKRISKELKSLSKLYESQEIKDFHNKARCEINKLYGKGWKEELDNKSIKKYPKNHKGRFNNMSY